MRFKNTDVSYGVVSKGFHWTMALLILAMLTMGFLMGDLQQPLRLEVYGIHKATGILVFFLAICRMLWITHSPPPSLPGDMPRSIKRAAELSHGSLYAFMVLMPLSGWAMSSAAGYPVSFYGLFSIPPIHGRNKFMAEIFHEAHEVMGFILSALIILHVSAALYHHFKRRDIILKRMLPYR